MNVETYNTHFASLIEVYLEQQNATAEYTLKNDGIGERSYIHWWSSTAPQPTPEQLMAIGLQSAQAAGARKKFFNEAIRLTRLTNAQVAAITSRLRAGHMFLNTTTGKVCACITDGSFVELH